MMYYSFSYTVFLALEFAFFESTLSYLEQHTKGNMEHKDHSTLDIFYASVISALISSLLTNWLEFIATNKQVDGSFILKEAL